MKKGHYGQYTGNARHCRKEEMIHDREMIYDAKNQIHNEDKSYRHTGKNSDKQDMIHERELIHDTKNQLHRADQDYKSSGPKSYQGASELGRKDKGGGSYENVDNSAQIKSMATQGKAYNDMIGSISDVATSAIKANKEKSSVATSVQDQLTDEDKDTFNNMDDYLQTKMANKLTNQGNISIGADGVQRTAGGFEIPEGDEGHLIFKGSSGNIRREESARANREAMLDEVNNTEYIEEDEQMFS